MIAPPLHVLFAASPSALAPFYFVSSALAIPFSFCGLAIELFPQKNIALVNSLCVRFAPGEGQAASVATFYGCMTAACEGSRGQLDKLRVFALAKTFISPSEEGTVGKGSWGVSSVCRRINFFMLCVSSSSSVSSSQRSS